MKLISRFTLSVLALVILFGPMISVRIAEAQTRQLALPVLIVNTGNLNVRSGPGPQYTVIAVAPGGTRLPVLGTNADNSWYLVATSAGAGWVDVSFTIPRGDFSYVPLITLEQIAAAQVFTPATLELPDAEIVPLPVPQLTPGRVIVNTGNLNVRSGPGPQYTVIAVVPGGVTLTPLGITADNRWFLVEGTFGRGWVSSQFTIFRGNFATVPVIENAY
ncbi:MAG: SH3 domain-containing protein [Anaerolinea sp.]|nr:SH3 domain-containing protein [Anaerolinea sp.]